MDYLILYKQLSLEQLFVANYRKQFKQFSDKFNKLFNESMNDIKTDNNDYNELVKVYENIRKTNIQESKKNKLSIF